MSGCSCHQEGNKSRNKSATTMLNSSDSRLHFLLPSQSLLCTLTVWDGCHSVRHHLEFSEAWTTQKNHHGSHKAQITLVYCTATSPSPSCVKQVTGALKLERFLLDIVFTNRGSIKQYGPNTASASNCVFITDHSRGKVRRATDDSYMCYHWQVTTEECESWGFGNYLVTENTFEFVKLSISQRWKESWSGNRVSLPWG